MLYPFDFKYTHAVVSRVPNTLKASFRQKGIKTEPLDIEKAKEQHNEYILSLRKLGLDVIELQADDTLPDSVFIDCVAVICNGTALIARPHLISRRKETEIIKSILRKEGLCIDEVKDPIATIDASDVLFTGREFFVGLSKRTNILGAKAVASAFPEYPVALIKLKNGSFHLKAYVSVAGPDLIAVGSSEMAKDILRQMKELAEYRQYKVITIPDQNGVNCVYLNSTLFHCSLDELPNSAKIFSYKIDYPRIELKNKEFLKVDRFLSCRSLLFTKRKIYTILASNYFSNLALSIIQPAPDQNEIKTVNILENGQIENANNQKGEIDKNQNEKFKIVKNPSGGFLDEQNLTELNLNITVNNDKNGG